MKIHQDFDRCILCNSAPATSSEHIIPQCIGGRLHARILCKPCNNGVGGRLVAELSKSGTVELAFEQLEAKYPQAYENLRHQRTLVGRLPDGRVVELSERMEEVLPKRQENGSLVFSTNKAECAMARRLTRFGTPAEIVAQYVRRFRELADDEGLQTPDGICYTKRRMPSLRAKIPARAIDDRVVVLIAFEFLAVLIGGRIYDPSLDAARWYLSNGKATNRVEVRSRSTNCYKPHHLILARRLGHAVEVQVTLFGWYASVVTFSQVPCGAVDAGYKEDLEHGISLRAHTFRNAEDGRWIPWSANRP